MDREPGGLQSMGGNLMDREPGGLQSMWGNLMDREPGGLQSVGGTLMDREPGGLVRGVAKSRTRLSNTHTHPCVPCLRLVFPPLLAFLLSCTYVNIFLF